MLVRDFPRLFAAVLLSFLLYKNDGLAQPLACPAESFSQAIAQSREIRLAELERLKRYADSCLTRADYYAYQGALLVSLGQGAAAIQALERALLLSPESPGVQFDYAQALAQTGERKSAAALLETLLAREDLHPNFRKFLEQQQSTLLQPQWVFDFKVTSLFGYESNLNNAPSARFYSFTPASGEVVLELDSASRAKGGAAWLTSFSASALTELGAGEAIYVLADIRNRQSGAATDYQQSEGAVIWRAPRLGGFAHQGAHPIFRLGASQLEFGGRTLFQGIRTEAALEVPIGICQGRAGLARENRRFSVTPSNDGSYSGLLVSAHCIKNRDLLSFQANIGNDHPDDLVRAGGRQRRVELGIGWTRGFPGFETSLTGAYSQLQDKAPYSPLLESGAVRRLDRVLLRAEARIPINSAWVGVVSAESSQQSSNLALFSVRAQAIYAGLRVRF